jgi:hypothetical protein
MPRNITTKAIGLAASAAVLAGAGLSTPVAVAQPAAADSGHGNQCFYTRNINGFQAPDDRTVYIRVGVRDIYRLSLMVGCTGLTFRQGIGLESTPATVVYRDTGIRNRCPVSDIHKLTPAEIAALPKRDLP